MEKSNINQFKYEKLSEQEQKERGILGRLIGIIASTKSSTRNGRRYGELLWKKVFKDPIFKEKLENRCFFGELGHPADRKEVELDRAAICLAEMPTMSADGDIYGVFDVLSTPAGKILKSLLDYGTTIGISSRGEGDLISGWDGEEEVDPETYDLEAWDAVIVPALKPARLTYVTESLGNNQSLKQVLTESLNSASEEDRLIMEDVIKANADVLNIDLDDNKKSLKESLIDDIHQGYEMLCDKFGEDTIEEFLSISNLLLSDVLFKEDCYKELERFANTGDFNRDIKGFDREIIDESIKLSESEISVKHKVFNYLYDKVGELLDNIAIVTASDIPDYDPDWCADDAQSDEMKNESRQAYSFVNSIINVLFANLNGVATNESLRNTNFSDFIDDANRITYIINGWYDELNEYHNELDLIYDTINNIQQDAEQRYESGLLENLIEDTVKKSNGKWTNKGKDGEHGTFKTKKEADAQRKAMFANSLHESIDEFDISILISNLEKILNNLNREKESWEEEHDHDYSDAFVSPEEIEVLKRVIEYFHILEVERPDLLDYEKVVESLKENYGHDGYFYILKHGLGPGTLPKDVNVLKTVDLGDYFTGAWLDRFLTTDELKEFDIPSETGIEDRLKALGKEDVLKESLKCYENEKTHTTYVTCDNGTKFAIKESLNKNKKVVYNVYNEKLDKVKTALSEKGAKKWITENYKK